jgi:O-acetyl-ADP-ribose deacetylase (regulator of RNase III)
MPAAHPPARRVEAVRGDITTEGVDAIVNAANSSLLGGGGVDGAIHRAAGPGLLAACREVRRDAYPDGLPVGDAVATTGADLAARWVIHTVGPNWHRGQRDPDLLRRCFTRSLDVAAEIGARSVAFPAVSAGVYGWDPAVVADIAVDAALRLDHGPGVELVRFVLFGDAVQHEFSRALTVRGVDPSG